MPLPADFVDELRKHFAGDIRNDDASRVLYSTDASIYQIEPLGVVLPRTQEDLHAAVELAARHRLPILPRGSGSSLAGQAIGEAMIIDCSRWLDRLIEIDPEARTATVEPGVILSTLNRAAAKFGLQFGPDPASSERATMGGVIANNATGAHSILYGMTADHLISANVIMADGSLATFSKESVGNAGTGNGSSRYFALRDTALQIREHDAELIKSHYPRAWRNSAGYRLNYLLPWSATAPQQWPHSDYPAVEPGAINMPALLAGSEGTLAVIRRLTVHLVDKPRYTALGILAYESPAAACDAVPEVLAHSPSAVELIPRIILQLARTVPGYASQMGWVRGDPAAVLVVEFSGPDPDMLIHQARQLRLDVTLAVSAEEQAQVWNVRRGGLGILDARPQSARPAAFVEDCAIPVERLGDFVREVESILRDHRTDAGFYAHASAGCLHIRPVLDLKTGEGVRSLRAIAERILGLTLRLGGAMASEHGDGLARGEWLEATYGRELTAAMRALKRAADPDNLLNPGKMFDAPPMDQHLRYGPAYGAHAWLPRLDFSRNGGLDVAIEQCNGQGVCRKDTGVMCPSFQATRDETHSTRGRANLLRFLITTGTRLGNPGDWDANAEKAAFEALDLCLACKGCKAECPSGVDMAKLKFEFLAQYYEHRPRKLRDYVFGYFHRTAQVLAWFAPVVNFMSGVSPVRGMLAAMLQIAPERPFPRFARPPQAPKPRVVTTSPRVIYLRDSFTHYVEPQVEEAALNVLARLGFEVIPAQTMAAGAALMSKGFLRAASRQAARLLDELERLDPGAEFPIVGVEPSEIYAVKREYGDLLPERKDELVRRSEQTWFLDEFLVRAKSPDSMRIGTDTQSLYFHPHCHQRAEAPATDTLPSGTSATVELLRRCGYDVNLSDAGCCGMAGTFGYEAEHYALSQQIGALKLIPTIRELACMSVVASGAACRMQIAQATGVEVQHPIVWVQRALEHSGGSPL